MIALLGNIFIFRRDLAIKKANDIDDLCQSYFLRAAVTPGGLSIAK